MPSSIESRKVLRASATASSILFDDSRATSASCSCSIWPRCYASCFATPPISTDPAVVA